VFNFSKSFQVEAKNEVSEQDLAKMKRIVFEGKPKRVFRTNRNLEAVGL